VHLLPAQSNKTEETTKKKKKRKRKRGIDAHKSQGSKITVVSL
jgi:flagellar biosynthesis protein FlhB